MPVRLDSHEKIYPNWAPVVLPVANGDPRFIEQRELLTVVIRIICNISLQQIDQTIVSSEWHPDSLTMITQEDYVITTSPASDTTESTDDESGVGKETMGHHFTSFDAWRDIEKAMKGFGGIWNIRRRELQGLTRSLLDGTEYRPGERYCTYWPSMDAGSRCEVSAVGLLSFSS